MNVAISIQHPSSVHFFKYPYKYFSQNGHSVEIYLREKGVASALLDAYNIQYETLVGPSDGSLSQLASTQLRYEYKLYNRIKEQKSDIILERVGLAASHVSAFTPTSSIAFTDNEKRITHRLAEPFLDTICTPKKLEETFNTTHKTYSGFKELSYLHPAVFNPSRENVEQAGINPDSTYFVLRASDFAAHHDVGKSGFTEEKFNEIINLLSAEGDIYIVGDCPTNIENNSDFVDISPHLIHDVLYYANLCIADSKTVPTEAAVLGTLSYRYNPFSDKNRYLEPLADEFGVLKSFSCQSTLIDELGEYVTNDMTVPSQNKIRKLISERYEPVSDYIVHLAEQQYRNDKEE